VQQCGRCGTAVEADSRESLVRKRQAGRRLRYPEIRIPGRQSGAQAGIQVQKTVQRVCSGYASQNRQAEAGPEPGSVKQNGRNRQTNRMARMQDPCSGMHPA